MNWAYMGFSHHKVPSLSKVAMRRRGSTYEGELASVMAAMASRMRCFAGPSAHSESGAGALVSLMSGACQHQDLDVRFVPERHRTRFAGTARSPHRAKSPKETGS